MTFLVLIALLSPFSHAAPARPARVASVDPELADALARSPSSVGSESVDTISTRISVPREKRTSLVIPSVVVHGFSIDKEVADQMPRKLDSGQTVVTPGVGLEYVTPGGFLALGGVLKDCYDNLAGLIQVGQRFRLGESTSVGYSFGMYARETPVACKTTVTRSGRRITTCDEFDNYKLKWMTRINDSDVDLIPMPFLHFTTALYKDRDVEIDFKIMSNFALNEFGISIPF